jgi:hypothetical protein
LRGVTDSHTYSVIIICIPLLKTDYVTRILRNCNVHKILVQPSHREELHVLIGSISNRGKLVMHVISLLEISPSQETTKAKRDIIIVDLREIE